ncbi:NucA/NucB deoxyribonuclease domain-containing protein [Amycolatopsis alba]|uniref:Deoxyribonuclease NucA/NucB domain-containing protein n=1 Tax=Amycolatopsis alba DSM 44262 TaxID=1125972 RepID=A0A229RDQ7_AMYAL|nr:hypothetical protein [Amycolatopsis alba]OXM44812.1 hypothetical protein CFP75_33360 [Amycolatopsis alba DSM 44262]
MTRHTTARRRVRRALATVMTTLAVCGVLATAPAAASTLGVSAAQADDLRTECGRHSTEAARVQGWARSRFEQCYHSTENVYLYDTNGNYYGKFDFELWILAFAYDGSRRVDYVTSVENVHQGSNLSDELTFLTIRFDCRSTEVTCGGGPLSRADTIRGWYTKSTMDTITITSPDTTGADPYKIVNFTETIGFTGEYRNGNTRPLYKDTHAVNHVRFDSANSALGAGKFKGTVFTDHIPRFDLHLTGAGYDQEARHVDDTLHHPERTFPALIGKNAPGASVTDPLHRLMDDTKKRQNHDRAVDICRDVWGPGYAAGDMECDEYPFRTTYEGASESTGGQPGNWHGSARPIPRADNGNGGTELGKFYGANRVLDRDAFTVGIVP